MAEGTVPISIYGEAIRITETAPKDRYTVTPGGTIVPESRDRGYTESREPIVVNEIVPTKGGGDMVVPKGVIVDGGAGMTAAGSAPTSVQPAVMPGSPPPRRSRGKKIMQQAPKIPLLMKGQFGQVTVQVDQAFMDDIAVVMIYDVVDGTVFIPPAGPETIEVFLSNGEVHKVVYAGLNYLVPGTNKRHVVMLKAE